MPEETRQAPPDERPILPLVELAERRAGLRGPDGRERLGDRHGEVEAALAVHRALGQPIHRARVPASAQEPRGPPGREPLGMPQRASERLLVDGFASWRRLSPLSGSLPDAKRPLSDRTSNRSHQPAPGPAVLANSIAAVWG